MPLVTYIDRKNTNCDKWDGLTEKFGEEGLLPMWVADMDFQVPPSVTAALDDYVSQGVFGYYHIPDTYYRSIIEWEESQHCFRIQRDWLRFSPGVVSAINWIIQIMTKPQDSVIVLTPVYYPFMRATENNGRRLITSDLAGENGSYHIDFDDFERKITENRVSLFILCSPHNPVGHVWTRAELTRLFDICRTHNVFVISDEIHHDLVFDGHTHIPSLTAGEYDDMMIALTAPSKTFNLAGCQNSIIIIPDSALRKKWDAYATEIGVVSGNAFGYIAAEAAYLHGAFWLSEVKTIIYDNYLYMKHAFSGKFPGITVSPLEGTYLAWMDLGRYIKARDMREFIQKKCRLALDYGDWFGGSRFGTFVRMNLATSHENVEIGVNAILEQLGTGLV